MKAYFQLQFKILNRKMIDFGIPLLIAYTILPLIFVLVSHALFEKTEFAKYIYSVIALSFISKLSHRKRNEFLKSIFNTARYKTLRACENIVYCLPFTLVLIYQKQFMICILINLCAIIITLFYFNTNINVTLPTPFSKKPFEFAVGFRKTFYVFPIAYFLTYISVSVGNFNLGVFAVLLIGILCFSYYLKIENAYFVWIYNLSPKEFLLDKTKICLTHFSLLSLPIIVILMLSFPKQIDILIIFIMLCYAYLTTIIFAKYSSFPNEMNSTQGILIVSSIMFPPILIIFIPLFYSQSIKKLNAILND